MKELEIKMSRKVTVELKIKVTMDVDEGVEIGDIISELDYEISDTTTQATIQDTEILDYEVTDSR
jgi:hypothetical protein